MEDIGKAWVSGVGSGVGAEHARNETEQEREYIDPPLQGTSTPHVKTYEQYWRLKRYDGWDGDMRWPHPDFTRDEAERAKNYKNRQQVGYMRDQAQISAYEREIAENRAATQAAGRPAPTPPFRPGRTQTYPGYMKR